MKKRIISMCLAMALICAMLSQTAIHTYATQSDNVAYEMREELIEFKLSDGTLYYTNTISYPYFLGDTAAEIKINSKYAAIIEKCRNNTTDFDALYQEVLQWSPDGVNGLPFYDDISAEVTYCNNGVISIKECSTMWSGGMHPYSDYVGYTYRISDGSELSLTDILSGSEHEVKSLIERYNQGAASYYKAEVVMASPFMLTSAGLCFLCNVGDAVPRAEIVIPFTEADAFSIFEESKSEASTTTDDTGYIGAVQKAIDEMQAVGWGSGYGALYDVDGNGIEELIMVYSVSMETDDGYGFPAKACSLYTMANGKAIQLIDKEILYVEAGGPSGYAAVVEHDGNIYFAITSETGETGGGPGYSINRYGTWKLYSINGESIDVNTTVEYDYFRGEDIEYEKSSALFNGESRSYREYEEWRDSLVKVLVVNDYYFDDKPESVMTLDELLAYLKENPVEDTSVSVDDSTFEDYARTEWIEQHMEYAASDEYTDEIIGGYNNRMMAVFRDALDDEDIESYETRKTICAILNLDIELSEADMYELIIAEILYGERGQYITEETYNQNLQNSVANFAKVLVNMATSGDTAKDIPADTFDSIKESYELLQTLNIGSEEYGTTYNKFISLIKSNVKDLKSKLKTELAGDATFTGLGIVIDGAFEQYEALEDILSYINNYTAYQSTSKQTQEVLAYLAVNVLYMYDGLYGVDEFIDELGLWDSMTNWADFQAALISVMEAIAAYEQEGASAIAEYAVEREREAGYKFGAKALKSVTVFAVEKAASCVPVINTILLVKNVTNVVISATVILDQIFTNVDEREYALDMLTKAYCISVMLDKTVDDCADCMSEDDFYSTTVFDESVSIYKKNLLFASGYALKYADMVLSNAVEALEEYDEGWSVDHLFTSRDELVAAVTWYSNSYKLLEEQQVEIREISCHDSNLQYDPLTDEIIYDFEDSRIYIVACPVDVIVTTDAGEQIAYLSDEENQISSGYEFYFHTIKLKDDSGEYIKVAIVPNEYQIELRGTNDGVMHAFVAAFTAGDVGEVETYFNIPIEKESVGYFEADSIETNGSSLVMDRVVYSNMESAEDIPSDSASNAVWIWIAVGVIACSIILIVILVKRSRK